MTATSEQNQRLGRACGFPNIMPFKDVISGGAAVSTLAKFVGLFVGHAMTSDLLRD